MKKVLFLLFLLAFAINYQPLLNGMGQPDGQLDAIYDYGLFKEVQKIHDIVYEALYPTKDAIANATGGRVWPIDPGSNQTKMGLKLVLVINGSDEIPNSLCTPWGNVAVIGYHGKQGKFQPITTALLKRLKVELLKNDIVEGGRVYKILAIDGNSLPAYQEQTVTTYRNQQVVRQAWQQLEARYNREKK